MYAIIVTGGKQYKVQQGDVLFVEKLEAEEGAEVKFDTVLAKKLNIIPYRPKKGSARRMGHRQPYTKVEITAINA